MSNSLFLNKASCFKNQTKSEPNAKLQNNNDLNNNNNFTLRT
jgi:hypothetical protein